MPSERQRRADLIRLIVTTRERFPHTPSLTAAMRRLIWQYALPVKPKRKRKAMSPTGMLRNEK
jgi:hypothetical protein